MTHTLWSRGRLLAESPLDFVRWMPKLRVGFLHPTPLGEKLLTVATGVSTASFAWGPAIREIRSNGIRTHSTSSQYVEYHLPAMKKLLERSNCAAQTAKSFRPKTSSSAIPNGSLPRSATPVR